MLTWGGTTSLQRNSQKCLDSQKRWWIGNVSRSYLQSTIPDMFISIESVHSFIWQSILLSVHPFICPSICLSIHSSDHHLFIYSSIFLSIHLSIHLSVCSSASTPDCLLVTTFSLFCSRDISKYMCSIKGNSKVHVISFW